MPSAARARRWPAVWVATVWAELSGDLATIRAAKTRVLAGRVVLVPSLARAGRVGALFRAVQALKLAAGAFAVALIGLDIRAGRRLTAGRRGLAAG